MGKITSRTLDTILFVGGTFLVAFNVFPGRRAFGRIIGDTEFHWSQEQLFMLALGIALITLGFLRRAWKKDESKGQ